MAQREHGLVMMITETTVHCGVGQDVGAVDLPIQRDPVTGTPVLYGSTVKGGWREAVRDRHGESRAAELFGRRVDDRDADLTRGAVGPGEARVLAYPVASAHGLFGYVVSPSEIARLSRFAASLGLNPPAVAESPVESEAYTTSDRLVLPGTAERVVSLGDDAFEASPSEGLTAFAGWLAETALGDAPDLRYWAKAVREGLVLVADDAFRRFVDPAVVVTRVSLEPDTKTVKPGALITQEVLPSDCVLWASVHGTVDAMRSLSDELGLVVTIGGDETLGRGLIRHRFVEVAR